MQFVHEHERLACDAPVNAMSVDVEDWFQVSAFERTLAVDSENIVAHYALGQIFALLGNQERSAHHAAEHARYKPDENARDRAVALARAADPAANHAAQSIVIYRLDRRADELRARPAPVLTGASDQGRP